MSRDRKDMQYLELMFRVGTLRLNGKKNEIRRCMSIGTTREKGEEEKRKRGGQRECKEGERTAGDAVRSRLLGS